MRNLKRALSLAMASIMILGMMVIGAGAASFDDLTDKDKIVNKEAVSVLNTLGVIAGKDDGAFDPTGIVTRAEMAKMICVVLNGGKNPQLGDLTTNFKDTKGHWAEPFIAWCTNLGIVAGTGSGNFEPNTTVTGSQAAKMLLVALGFNAEIEKYVGGSWQLNVDVAANQNDLYDNLGNINTSEGLSRDNAAQMIYNALDVKMVEYKNVYVSENGTLTSKPQVSSDDKKTLLEEKFGAIKVEGVVVGNEMADMSSKKTDSDYAGNDIIGTSLDAGKTRIMITNGEDQSKYNDNTAYIFTTSTNTDMLGKAVSMYVKPSTTSEKSTVIGSVIASNDGKSVVDATSDSIKDVADDNNMELAGTTKIATNYNNMVALSDTVYKQGGTAGVTKTLIDTDNDGKLDYVLMNTYMLGRVTNYSTSDKGKITVTFKGNSYVVDDKKDVVGFENVAKDDYVLASFIGGKLHVEKPETVTGVLSAYKNNSAATTTTDLTVDGKDFKVSNVGNTYLGSDLKAGNELFVGNDRSALDVEASFYLDKNGYIVASGDLAAAAGNYAFVQATDNLGGIDNRVKVTLSDGTTGTYTVSSKSSAQIGNGTNDVKKGGVYAYSLTSDKQIKLTVPAASPSLNNGTTYEKGKASIVDGNNTYYASNSTVFFYVSYKANGTDVDKVNVYVGREKAPSIDTITGGTVAVKNNATNKNDAVAVVFGGVKTKSVVGDHMFVYSLGSVGSDYTLANVVLNGKDTTETVKVDAGSQNDLKADTLFTYTINSDGYYEIEPIITSGANFDGFFAEGTVSKSYNSSIVVALNNDSSAGHNNAKSAEYLVDSKTVVVNNDPNDKTPSVSFSSGVGDGDTVQVLLNDDKAVMIVITDDATSTTGGGSGSGSGSGNFTGTVLNGAATAEEVNTALQTEDVKITGNYAPSARLNIPNGRTMYVEGNYKPFTVDNISTSGKLVVTGTYNMVDVESIVGDVKAKDITSNGDISIEGSDVEAETIGATGAISVDKNSTLTVAAVAADLTTSGTVKIGTTSTARAAAFVGGNVTGDVIVKAGTAVMGAVTGTVTVDGGVATIVSAAGAVAVNGGVLNIDAPVDVAVPTTATVESGATLNVKGGVAKNTALTIKSGATLVMPDGEKLGAGSHVTSDGSIVVELKDATLNGQTETVVHYTVASGSTVTLSADHRFGRHAVTDFTGATLKASKDGVKFVASGGTPTVADTLKGLSGNIYNDKADATADSIIEGTDVTYVWTTFTETAGSTSITGWLYEAPANP